MRTLIALLSLTLVIACSHADAPPKGLSGYKGQDLRTLDDKQHAVFLKELQILTGDKPEEESTFGEDSVESCSGSRPLWAVDEFRSGRARWAVLEGNSDHIIPGISAMKVYIFDEHWNRICKEAYRVHYRAFVDGITVERRESLHQDLIVARLADGHIRQYYALAGTNVVLVWQQTSDGRPKRSYYKWSMPLTGPAVPKRSKEQWISSLASTSAVEQLASLVWLTGIHLSSEEERRTDHDQESLSDSMLHEAVRDDPATKRIVQELKGHTVDWIREYATLGMYREQD